MTPRDIERALPLAGRRDLRHVVGRDARRVPYVPPNRGAVAGLYLVGGSSHPGRRPAARADERPDRRRHDRGRSRDTATDDNGSPRRPTWRALAGRAIAAGLVLVAACAPPIRRSGTAGAPGTVTPLRSISVVVPARDEAGRIGPLLDLIVGAPGVAEVIVVDDSRATRRPTLATHLGARVVRGTDAAARMGGQGVGTPAGSAGRRARTGSSRSTPTPDPTRRLPPRCVARAEADGVDLLTVAGRFECPTAPSRWLHAAMLTTLVYRFGPPGSRRRTADRMLANGQCMAVRPRTVPRPGWDDARGRRARRGRRPRPGDGARRRRGRLPRRRPIC